MRWTLITTIAAAAVLATPVLAQEFSGKRIRVTLDGAQEPGGGDSDGTGTAMFRLSPGQEQLCYTLSVQGILPAFAAHIHEAPAGVEGPIVIPLSAPTSGSSGGCIYVEREELMELIREPENYYVNVHNSDFPGGAVRAQLSD